jgi:hypothetical protein
MGPEHWSMPMKLGWIKGELIISGKIRAQTMQTHMGQIKEIIFKNQENQYCTWRIS